METSLALLLVTECNFFQVKNKPHVDYKYYTFILELGADANSHVLAACLSCRVPPVPTVLSWLSRHSRPVPVVLSQLSCTVHCYDKSAVIPMHGVSNLHGREHFHIEFHR
jgi:hypothetical protein